MSTIVIIIIVIVAILLAMLIATSIFGIRAFRRRHSVNTASVARLSLFDRDD
jgi:flagellar basal body-associated protein FliL